MPLLARPARLGTILLLLCTALLAVDADGDIKIQILSPAHAAVVTGGVVGLCRDQAYGCIKCRSPVRARVHECALSVDASS